MKIDNSLYPNIYKRKSFHLFRNIGGEKITNEEIEDIYRAYEGFASLCPQIKTKIKIVPGSETSCRRGQEYCVLIYSEKKDDYLKNVGYIGEQLDLYLVSKNIGSLWFGLGKTNETSYDDLDYVIMIAIAKIDDEMKFRKDMFKSKRKTKEEIWIGEEIPNVTDIVRFAPSACNTQPWIVKRVDNSLQVFRYKKLGKRGIMPVGLVTHYNKMDIGIFLCFLELCLDHNGIDYERTSYVDNGIDEEMTLVANYRLK